MNTENKPNTPKELYDALIERLDEVEQRENDDVDLSPHSENYTSQKEADEARWAQIHALRLRGESPDFTDVPNEPNPVIMLNWCITNQNILNKKLSPNNNILPTGTREKESETTPKPQVKPLKITETHKRAYRSYQWVCEHRPDLIPESPTRVTQEFYDYMKENCSEYFENKPPAYGTWARYLRLYEQVLGELKDRNIQHLTSEQPLSGAKPDDIQNLDEITNRFKKD